jgi:hypothetical protein
MATVKFHEGHKTAPILTSGNVSPAIIAQFVEYLNAYFHKAKIADNEKVRSTLTSFQDIRLDNWVKNNRDRFLAEDYTFTEFTAELRKRFLDPHWENMIVRNVVNSQMSSTESFIDYANRVMQGNNLLIGTTSRLNPKDLRSKLEINMAGYLAEKIAHLRPTDKDRITAIETFEDWFDEICIIDRDATADLKRITDFAAEHIAKRQRTDLPDYPKHNTHFQNSFQNSSTPNIPQYTFNPVSGANATVQGQRHFTPHVNNITMQPSSNTTAFRGGSQNNNVRKVPSCWSLKLNYSINMTVVENVEDFTSIIAYQTAPTISRTPILMSPSLKTWQSKLEITFKAKPPSLLHSTLFILMPKPPTLRHLCHTSLLQPLLSPYHPLAHLHS